MSKNTHRLACLLGAASAAALAFPALADEAPEAQAAAPGLEQQFQNPPQSARPRVWWHWMNGNITKDGIAKDMAWMKRVGIGGMQNFDASLMTPQIVDKRLVYMTPEWKDAFKFAASEADRLGLELAIAASPGWSETGGPWVKPEDGLKKLVWSETIVAGGKPFTGKLAAPPAVTGPFGNMSMQADISEAISDAKRAPAPMLGGDIAVLAIPELADSALTPRVTLSDGVALDADKLAGSDLNSEIKIPCGSDQAPTTIVLTYAAPHTVRSAKLFIAGAKMIFGGPSVAPVLEASDDGSAWRKVAEIPVTETPVTVSFVPVTAKFFRFVLHPATARTTLNSLGAGAPGIAMKFDLDALTQGSKTLRLRHLSLSQSARVDQGETKAGFAIAQDYFALHGPADGAAGTAPAQVLNLTARLRPDGSLDWKAPKLPDGQQWRVLRLGWSLLGTTNHPAPAEATGLEVDKFDGDAVRGYLEHYIGMYKDASGGLIGKRGVQAILTDSIEVGAANWTPKMIAQFKRLRGYDPTPWLPALTGALVGSREDSDKFLFDYRRTLADLMASEHYGTVAQVAHENGLKVYGEALEDHRPSLGDDMAMRSHADIPMAAMWTHSRKDGPKLTYLADIKGAASVAHIYGQNLVAAESMTAAMNPWYYGPADLKRIIDLEFVTGVNRPVVHTSVHVPLDDKKPGLSLFIFGQYFNRNESWAELARPWVDYMARNALLLQQGRNVADVGYFYGEEAPLTGLYGDSRVADAPKTRAYDFVNADVLMGGLVNQGDELVSSGGARYKALYLGGSSRKMTLATLRRLAELVEGGATVVGVKPEGSPGLAGDAADYAALVAKLWGGDGRVGKGRVIASNDIDAALTQIGVAPDFSFSGASEGAGIPFLHRKLADGDSYFLVNRSDKAEAITARFRVTGKVPELWHAETGQSEAVNYTTVNGETVIPLELGIDGSVHVVFRKDTTAMSLSVVKPQQQVIATLSGPWSVHFQKERGAPESATFAALAPLDTNADPAIKYFSGEATYEQDFKAPKGWKPGQPLWLDLGEAREVAEVTLNGQVAGYSWHAPYRLDIGSQAKRGTNHVAIRVANLWVNRLIGDQQPGATKLTWTAMPTYRADAPLRRSGLIGPVTLVGEVQGKGKGKR